ncbi:uncharacterized protein LOC120172731 [Hibiscus syriacus]|uniref:uncharacterized protein LOC120172731 n=1 Tax=Hibiscus syriacus TaxID=106335 RepID=UPI0019216BA0|nr:uncharacterized protein LOC120172731 [Hibiscus syriacus]
MNSFIEDLKGLLNYSFPEGAADFLTREVSDLEIKEALFKQGNDKSPGPDVFSIIGLRPASLPQCTLSLSLNGSLVGYFKGARGIRQGDLLSPYLFVIAMNVLSTLLDAAIKHGIFKFHPKCRRISLTHLCFADDLLVFCHGYLDVVLGVQSTLDKFYELSGLKLNAHKTKLYVYGLNVLDLEQIRLTAGFRLGQLLMRYLGVPLMTHKLTGKDCEALLTKIKDKLWQWSNTNLSYRGRLQLVKIGSDSPAKGTRVGWNQICSLKSEGGLGLRSLVLLGCRIQSPLQLDPTQTSEVKVNWHKLIWFPAHIPKFSLISWMVILEWLPTKDRLVRFGLATDNVCGLCGFGIESRDHLFAECSFAKEV